MRRKHNPWVALVALILLATLLLLTCAGCKSASATGPDRFTWETYTDNKATAGVYIITDNETGVRYLYVKLGYGGGLTVLQDAEG